MELRFTGIPTTHADAIRAGGPDANGAPALLRDAVGSPGPCRHCLKLILDGEERLVLSYRPFEMPQPYAEAGPIFLHAKDCERYVDDSPPGWFSALDPAIVRGYGPESWIRYDTGTAIAGSDVATACQRILADETVAYVHVRSKFGCLQCRVDRAS